jgi:hypothetical protein
MVDAMPSFLESIEALNLPKVAPPKVPASVALLLDRLGLTMSLTCPAAPEQWEVNSNGQPCGYIRTRWGSMSVDYPNAGDEELYEGPVDGFGAFTDHERETKLLLALGLIAARLLRT